MPNVRTTFDTLDEEVRNRLESDWVAFERGWSSGCLDRFVDRFATLTPELRHVAIEELVRIDLDRHRTLGIRRSLEDYAYLFGGTERGAREVDSAVADSDRGRFPKEASADDTMREGLTAPALPRLDETAAYIRAKNPDVRRGTLTAGQTFGDFRILKILGAGGMGEVYLAEELALERQVALKTPRLDGPDGETLRRRFRTEARSVARLEHRNICPILSIGQEDGVDWLSMPYFDGETFAATLKRSRTSGEDTNVREAVVIFSKLARAIEYAHASGLVHRDLKPANFMIDRRTNEPIVMDFGLAVAVEVLDGRLTRTGEMMGTFAYMPLEQANGELHLIGPRSDVYSLGASLYEALTGSTPVTGAPAQMMAKLFAGTIPPPSTLRPDLDPALDRICVKALGRLPSDRWPSMRDFADALDAWLAGPKVAVPPTRISSKKNDPWGALRTWTIGIGAAASLGVVAFSVAVLSLRPNNETFPIESMNVSAPSDDDADAIRSTTPWNALSVDPADWLRSGPDRARFESSNGALVGTNEGPLNWDDHLIVPEFEAGNLEFRYEATLRDVASESNAFVRVDPSQIVFGGMRGYEIILRPNANGPGQVELALSSRVRETLMLDVAVVDSIVVGRPIDIVIRAVDNRVQVAVDGTTAIDYVDSGRTFVRGGIALGFEIDADVEYRDLATRILPDAPLQAERSRWTYQRMGGNEWNESWGAFVRDGDSNRWIHSFTEHPSFGRTEFVEIERTEEFVELTSPAESRRYRLYSDRCDTVRADGITETGYVGYWEG